MKIDYEIVNPLELALDYQNPRYLSELRNDDEVRSYLIEHEDSLSVAHSLKELGLLPGDMVICIPEGGRLVVIEGNRRISIMQMLLDRSLIPEKYIDDMPLVSEEVLEDLRLLTIQVIGSRDDALSVMANRHIEGIRQWKPLAKKKFFASRFDSGISVEELSATTNIKAGEIRSDITDYKFFIRNYEMYKKHNSSFDVDLSKISIDRFLRVFTTIANREEESMGAKAYLMMDRSENLEYISDLPDELFTDFTQHVFSKAYSEDKNDSINTRSNFDDIPNVEEWKLKIDKSRAEVRRDIADKRLSKVKSDELDTSPKSDTSLKPDTKKVSGGPSSCNFMGDLVWKNILYMDNSDHAPFIRVIGELYNMSQGKRGKGYVRYPNATAILMRSGYEQGLILLMKTTNLWDDFVAFKPESHHRTISEMEKFISSNKDICLGKGTVILKTFQSLQRGDVRRLLNDYTHDLYYIYPTKDSLESIAGNGMFGFLQSVIDRVEETSK